MRRHDLARLSPAGWQSVYATHPDLPALPVVRLWAERGWPLIGRRALVGEGAGTALGLPLPPSAGRRRFAALVPPALIAAICPPPALADVVEAAPPAWHTTLARIGEIAARHGAEARVYGSLAFQAITGLDYLTDRSDLDLLLGVHRGTDLRMLAAELAAVANSAPMSIDGELAGPTGAAVKWRELLTTDGLLLVRTSSSLALGDTDQLFASEVAA